MRIATSTAYSQGVTSINTQSFNLNKTLLQISSGKRITVPSDDPAAAARVLGLNQAKSRTEKFQDNIITAKGSLEVEETAINGVVTSLQRIRELSIQANNDTYDATQRADIAEEIEQRLGEIIGLTNTTNGNGEFLFGGFNNRSTPFTDNAGTIQYNGDQGQQLLQIGPTRQIASGDNGYELFMHIRNSDNGNIGSTAPMSIFEIVDELDTVLKTNAGSPTSLPVETFHVSMSRIIGNLDDALGQLVDAEATIGARLNAIENQESVNEDYLVQLAATLSDTQDLDYTEAISRLEQQQIGLQASQQSFTEIQGLSLFNYI